MNAFERLLSRVRAKDPIAIMVASDLLASLDHGPERDALLAALKEAQS